MDIVRFKKMLQEFEKKAKEFENKVFDFWDWKLQIEQEIGWVKLSFKKIVKLVAKIEKDISTSADEIIKEAAMLINSKADPKLKTDLKKIKSAIKQDVIQISIFWKKNILACGERKK